uniref:DUF4371 domain-containing protein n=1 Tax=Fundulus heteroclitus TaxID=8078 RepID=A0A3Q2QNS1_FUNHE
AQLASITVENEVRPNEVHRFLIPQQKSAEREESAKKRRKYDPDYLKLGFTRSGSESAPLPQCVVCREVLANDSMRLCKLATEFFRGNGMNCAALHIAKAGKPHTDGETFLLPAARDMCSVMLGEAATDKLDTTPITVNTIQQRISNMAYDVREQVVNSVHKSPVDAIQLDESTDVAHCAQLMVFKALNDFYKAESLEWSRWCGICTDGARAMTGRHSGLVKQVQTVAPAAVWKHCIIHRQALAAMTPKELHVVLDEAVKIVTTIKLRALNARLFKILCNEIQAAAPVFSGEVALSGKSSPCSLSCQKKSSSPRLTSLSETSGRHELARPIGLSYIFQWIISLNTSLQGKECHVYTAHSKVSGFRKKLDVLCDRIGRGSVEMFPTLEDVLEKTAAHLSGLCDQFREYFGNPFSFPPTVCDELSIQEEEALVELSSNIDLKQRLVEMPITRFWLSVESKFPHVSAKVCVFFPAVTLSFCPLFLFLNQVEFL